jgi:hypothetical protein
VKCQSSQQDTLGLAFGKSLIVQSNFGDAKHGNQQANDCAKQSRPLLVSMDFSKQVSTVANSEITSDNIGNASVNPASDG